MIYKFKFEVYTDDNDNILHMRKEESGNFFWAWSQFIGHVVGYIHKYHLHGGKD